jgi:two-component system, NtrC family, response regulator HydG
MNWSIYIPCDAQQPPTADAVEREHVRAVLDFCTGNKSKAAAVLGFDRRTLYRKLKAWGIEATRAEVEARADRLDAELERLKAANP